MHCCFHSGALTFCSKKNRWRCLIRRCLIPAIPFSSMLNAVSMVTQEEDDNEKAAMQRVSAKSGSKRTKKARQKQRAANVVAAAAAAASQAPEAVAADATRAGIEAISTTSMPAPAQHQHQQGTTGISVDSAAGAHPPSADRTDTPPAATKADAVSGPAEPSTAAPPDWTVCRLTGVRCEFTPSSSQSRLGHDILTCMLEQCSIECCHLAIHTIAACTHGCLESSGKAPGKA